MAKCKFCGQGVRTAPVFHPACWEQRANKVMEEFCDEYCRFPREIEDHDDLIEHCSECVAAELLRAHGITVFSDGQIPQLLAWMAQREQNDDSM